MTTATASLAPDLSASSPTTDATLDPTLDAAPRAEIDPETLALDEADRLAVALAGVLHRIAVPLARAAAAFVEISGWKELAFARQSDYTREHLSRSSRWLRQMARLGRALGLFPALREALAGDDGGPPLGVVAAVEIAGVATEVSVDEWISRARDVPFRTLRDDVRRARTSMKEVEVRQREAAWREEAAAFAENELDDPVERFPLRFFAPPQVRAAFEEALALHRAVTGGEATVASFCEALVAEAHAGPASPADAPVSLPRPARRERDLITLEARRRRSPKCAASVPGLGRARDLLRRAKGLFETAGRGDFAELDEQLQALLALEHEIRVELGKLLVVLAGRGAFRKSLGRPLPFTGVGDFGQNRLGLARRTAESFAFLARRLEDFPVLRRRYERGRLPEEKTLLLIRFFGRRPVDEGIEKRWAYLGETSTVKRLRDQLNAAEQARVESDDGATPPPLDDGGWYASLQRRPGMSHERVVRLAARARARTYADWIPFRLRLPFKLAMDLCGAMEAARGKAPFWAGLVELLLDYTATHDPPGPSLKKRAVYERDGYRCAAPGCTSRRHLEDHHIIYRSRGGGDELTNRVTLCRFHHQRGEHGGLMTCRGTAPLGLTFRMGRRRYRNEKRLARESSC